MSSGGSNYRSVRSYKEEIGKLDDQTAQEQLESDVAKLLKEILKSLNDRDVEAINRHIDEIAKKLDDNIEGAVKCLFGGSVAKHTFVDGLSDIDTLLIVNDSNLADKSPAGIKQFIKGLLENRFPNTPVEIGKMAVTIHFKDYDIQIVPVLRSGEKFQVPNQAGGWSDTIKPGAFTSKLSSVNHDLNNKLVPMIKLAKSIIYSYPENKMLSGYHIESLALEVFKNYNGSITTSKMLTHFFERASELVLKPITDRTGQSRHVDDYLKGAHSLERELVANELNKTSRKIKSFTKAEQWNQLFE